MTTARIKEEPFFYSELMGK